MAESKNSSVLAKNTFTYLPGKILGGFIGFISVPIYSMFFLPEEYGVYSLIIGAVSLSSSILSGWLAQSGLRFYSGKEDKPFFTTLIISWAFINIIGLILAVAGFMLLDGPVRLYWGIAGILFVTANTYKILNNLIRAAEDALLYSTLLVMGQAIRLILTVVFIIKFDLGVMALLFGIMLSDLVAIVIAGYKLQIIGCLSLRSFSMGKARGFLSYGVPLLGVSAISWTLSMSDRYILAYFRDTHETGLYSISYNLVNQPLGLIITGLSLAALPAVLKAWKLGKRDESEKLLVQSLKYYFVLIIPAFVGLVALRKEIFTFLLADNYFNGNIILPWVALGIILNGLTYYTNVVWKVMKKTNVILILTGTAALVNLGLNIAFIPRYGFIAAAVTTMVSYGIYFVSSLVLSRKHFKFHPDYSVLIKSILASIIMGVVLYAYKGTINSLVSLSFAVLLGVFVYGVMQAFLGGMRDEVRIILQKVKT